MNHKPAPQNAKDTPKQRELTLDIEKLEDRVAPAFFSLSLSSSYNLLANKAGPLLTENLSSSYYLK